MERRWSLPVSNFQSRIEHLSLETALQRESVREQQLASLLFNDLLEVAPMPTNSLSGVSLAYNGLKIHMTTAQHVAEESLYHSLVVNKLHTAHCVFVLCEVGSDQSQTFISKKDHELKWVLHELKLIIRQNHNCLVLRNKNEFSVLRGTNHPTV